MQGKTAPVHISFYRGCPSGQQCIGAGHPQRKSETENIGTVQKPKDGTEFCQDQIGHRHNDQKRHERTGGLDTYS